MRFMVPLICHAQAIERAGLAPIFNFEAEQTGGPPSGWGGGPRETLFTDGKTVHSGKWPARLQRDAAIANSDFSSIAIAIPIDFGGTRLDLRGFLKLQGVTGFAGLWMRQDGDSGAVAFDNMENRHVNGYLRLFRILHRPTASTGGEATRLRRAQQRHGNNLAYCS
jgi:hypothetical protein